MIKFKALTVGDRFYWHGSLWTKLCPDTARRHSKECLALGDKSFGYMGDSVCSFDRDDIVSYRSVDHGISLDATMKINDGCVCHGNWRDIIRDNQANIGGLYVDNHGIDYRFYGIVWSDDDFYYVMSSSSKTIFLSCVGDIEGHGFMRACNPCDSITNASSMPFIQRINS